MFEFFFFRTRIKPLKKIVIRRFFWVTNLAQKSTSYYWQHGFVFFLTFKDQMKLKSWKMSKSEKVTFTHSHCLNSFMSTREIFTFCSKWNTWKVDNSFDHIYYVREDLTLTIDHIWEEVREDTRGQETAFTTHPLRTFSCCLVVKVVGRRCAFVS